MKDEGQKGKMKMGGERREGTAGGIKGRRERRRGDGKEQAGRYQGNGINPLIT